MWALTVSSICFQQLIFWFVICASHVHFDENDLNKPSFSLSPWPKMGISNQSIYDCKLRNICKITHTAGQVSNTLLTGLAYIIWIEPLSISSFRTGCCSPSLSFLFIRKFRNVHWSWYPHEPEPFRGSHNLYYVSDNILLDMFISLTCIDNTIKVIKVISMCTQVELIPGISTLLQTEVVHYRICLNYFQLM